MGLPKLDYSVTRSYQQKWLAPISYAGAFIAIVLLAVLNAALVGYETITVFQSDPNVVQKFWYDRFVPYRTPKPGSLCAPHVFNVGDTFTTQNTIFAWSIQSIEKASAGSSGVTYKGSVLDSCDVKSIFMTGDLRTWTVDYSVIISCIGGGAFDLSATTSFSMSSLPGKLAPLLGYQRSENAHIGDPRASILDRVIRSASDDLGQRASIAFSTNNKTPVMFSAQVDFAMCPASLSKSSPNCASKPPTYVIENAASISITGALTENNDGPYDAAAVLGTLFEPPSNNILQTIYAAVRIDLGIDSPNNFLLHKAVTNQTLDATFPVTPDVPANSANAGLISHLYRAWEDPTAVDSSADYTWMLPFLPLNVTGLASIQVVYLCQFQNLKSPGSLVVSVLVATLSMFSSGWALYLLILGMLAKRGRDANQCEGHLADSQVSDSQPYYQGIPNNSDPKYGMPMPMKG